MVQLDDGTFTIHTATGIHRTIHPADLREALHLMRHTQNETEDKTEDEDRADDRDTDAHEQYPDAA